MPFVSVIIPGDQSYVTWELVLNGKKIPYGLFIGEVANFIIVALALFFFIVKFLGFITRAKKAAAAAPAAPPPPTVDQQLLTEIRDLLKK